MTTNGEAPPTGVSNVVPFPRSPDDAERGPLESDRPDYGDCQHPRPLSLDVEAHQLLCGACGQVLDPFDFLLKLTDEWGRYNAGYRAARAQERAVLGRLEALKRAERNAKARVRKAGVVLTYAQARVVRQQLVGLQSVAIDLAGGVEEARRLARLKSVDAERLGEALAVLRDQLDLDRPLAVGDA